MKSKILDIRTPTKQMEVSYYTRDFLNAVVTEHGIYADVVLYVNLYDRDVLKKRIEIKYHLDLTNFVDVKTKLFHDTYIDKWHLLPPFLWDEVVLSSVDTLQFFDLFLNFMDK